MRFIRRMLGFTRDRNIPEAPVIQPPPPHLPDLPPVTLTDADRAELDHARRRLEPKWSAVDRAVDTILADFERGDLAIKVVRR